MSNAQAGNASRQTKTMVRICPVPVLRRTWEAKVAGEIPAVDGLCGEFWIAGRPRPAGSMAAPGKAPAWARAISGNVAGATLDAALGDFRRHVVERQVPAKYPIGHRDDD